MGLSLKALVDRFNFSKSIYIRVAVKKTGIYLVSLDMSNKAFKLGGNNEYKTILKLGEILTVELYRA